MAKDNINFYENFDWKSLKSADLEEKIQRILKMISTNSPNTFFRNCRLQFEYPQKLHVRASLFDSLNVFISLKKPY